ncbi:hypothetical protein RHCRD62_100048 [Rhodococcus sp. RD6.2]|nr:hypothetical protein RHCRD62_100048 [Rhodococcus sp. RD6.2]
MAALQSRDATVPAAANGNSATAMVASTPIQPKKLVARGVVSSRTWSSAVAIRAATTACPARFAAWESPIPVAGVMTGTSRTSRTRSSPTSAASAATRAVAAPPAHSRFASTVVVDGSGRFVVNENPFRRCRRLPVPTLGCPGGPWPHPTRVRCGRLGRAENGAAPLPGAEGPRRCTRPLLPGRNTVLLRVWSERPRGFARRRGDADARNHDECDGSEAGEPDGLVEEQPSGDERHDRLEAEEHPEDVTGQAAQGGEFERVRNHRRQDGGGRRDREQSRVGQRTRGTRRADGEHTDRRDRQCDREAPVARHGLAHLRRREHVQRPEHRRDESEGDADGVQGRCGQGVLESEERHARQCQRHAREIAPASGEDRSEQEWTEELDRDRDREGNAGDGGIEEPVHPGEGAAEDEHGPPLMTCPPVRAGTDHDEEDRRRDRQSQRRDRPRSHDGKEAGGRRRPELQRDARSEDQCHGGRVRAGASGAGEDGHLFSIVTAVSSVQRIVLRYFGQLN